MNILIVIFVILFVLSLTDFVLLKQKRIHNQIYHVAFFITFFLFTIKYYYGADIAIYVPMYEELESPSELIKFGIARDHVFEIGFVFFCSIIKYLGFSYWWMTVIVSLIYFYSIYKLFSNIPSKKTFALYLLVILEFNLIFATHRQALSVSFFILMFLAYNDKKYIKMFIYMILTSLMHKSGVYFGVGIFFLLLLNIKVKQNVYFVLVLLLFILIVLPIRDLVLSSINYFSLQQQTVISIDYHLSYARKFQPILIIYVIGLMSIFMYKNKNALHANMNIILFLGAILTVMLYQYYPILWRLRSYFIPFAIVYIFTAIHEFQMNKNSLDCPFNMKKYYPALNVCIVLIVALFCFYSIIANYRAQNKLKSRIYETSTVFDLFQTDSDIIKTERLMRAYSFWENENLEAQKETYVKTKK